MSLYSQSPLYAQPYTASYTQPGVGYHYTQSTLPPPMYHLDPNTFRRDYSQRLAELTINSRPIIQNLSMYAQEFTRFAEIVAQCIEAHIRRVSAVRFTSLHYHRCPRVICRSHSVLCVARCHVSSL